MRIAPGAGPQTRAIEPYKMFEILITIMLRNNGFRPILPKHDLSGRSQSNHQIDSAGLFFSRIPFVYDIVLIGEGKLWKRETDLNAVRNLLSVLNDLRETLPNNPVPPDNWPEDLYKGGITVNCLGVIFSNGGFSEYARRFAYSNAIYIVYVQIETDWMHKLIRKLQTLNLSKTCQKNLLDELNEGWSTLKALFDSSFGDLDEDQRDTLTKIVEIIIKNCPEFRKLKDILGSLHLVSVDGDPAFLRIDAVSRRRFHKYAINLEVNRGKWMKSGKGTGYEDWYESEFEEPAQMRVGKLWLPSQEQEVNEKEFVPVREVMILLPRTKREAVLLLPESAVQRLRKRMAGRLSFPLSRGLLSQLTMKLATPDSKINRNAEEAENSIKNQEFRFQ